MGPSSRRKSRRKTLFKKQHLQNSTNQENSSMVVSTPTKPSNGSACSTPNLDHSSKDVGNVDSSYNTSCSTPKAERFRIPEIKTCPPAPKKRRILTNFSKRTSTPIAFFAPPDIELFFYLALRGIQV